MLLVEPQNSEEAELNFMVICLPVSIFHGSSFAMFALNQDGERNREKVYWVNDQDKRTSWNSFEEHSLYQFMYKPNIKRTERGI